MSNALLNADKVQDLLEKKGLQQNWVIKQIGLKSTAGHMLFRNGLLPKDDDLRISVLEKLSEILGVEAKNLLLHIGSKKSA